jgi:hypothetical protein
MIADLVEFFNNSRRAYRDIAYRSVLFPPPASRTTSYQRKVLVRDLKTYVYRESTKAIPSLSILLMHCSQRTTLQFLYVVLPKQSFGWSTGQGERASVERPFAAGHLHDAVSPAKEI